MNQTITIVELANLSEQKGELFYFSADGHYTTQALLNMGAYVCYECGNICSVDDEGCHKCGASKFILQPPKIKKKKVKEPTQEHIESINFITE